jgi:hypothetical protein
MAEKTIVQKLLIKEGYRVLVVNAPDGYVAALAEPPAGGPPAAGLPAGVTIVVGLDSAGPFDLIQTFVSSQAAFEAQLVELKALLKSKGLLWITYPKGAAKIKSDITRDTIWRYARTVGLEGVAMVAVDETWSAMRLKLVS